jgi:chromosome segregation ATPase
MTEAISKPQSSTFDASSSLAIPEDAPPWAQALFAKADRNEAAIDQLSEYLGRIMAVVAPLRETVNVTRGLCEATALRVARIDQEREMPLDKIERLRKDVRALKERRQSSPDDQLSTDQRNAISREEAERIAREADEERERKNEIERLVKENRDQAARLQAIEDAAADRRKFFARGIVVPIVTGLVVALVSVYATYRLTRPALSVEANPPRLSHEK